MAIGERAWEKEAGDRGIVRIIEGVWKNRAESSVPIKGKDPRLGRGGGRKQQSSLQGSGRLTVFRPHQQRD